MVECYGLSWLQGLTGLVVCLSRCAGGVWDDACLGRLVIVASEALRGPRGVAEHSGGAAWRQWGQLDTRRLQHATTRSIVHKKTYTYIIDLLLYVYIASTGSLKKAESDLTCWVCLCV